MNSKTDYINKIFFKTIAEALPQYIFWKDENSIYLGCNRNFANLVGLDSPKDIIGKTDYDLQWQSTGYSAEFFRDGDRNTLAGKPIINQEEILALPNGKKLITLVSKLPIIDNGVAVGIVGYFTDITELREAEERERKALLEKTKAEQAQKAAEVTTERMQALAAALAHEMRNPLNTISGRADGVKNDIVRLIQLFKNKKIPEICDDAMPNLNHTLEDLNTIAQETNAAFLFIDMLLMNMRLTEEEAKQNFVPCSMKACIEKTLARYPFKGQQKNQVFFQQPENDFQFMGNELFMIHVFFNLLKNALYYIAAKAGRTEGTISLWMEPGNPNRVHVKDTGIGIPQAVLPHIFEKFYTRTRHGAGVGLSFCKMVMESFGGTISCESVEGAYTDFIIELPAV